MRLFTLCYCAIFLNTLGFLGSYAAVYAAPAVEQVAVFRSGEEGYNTFRIPAVVRAQNGELLAFCEGRKDGGGDSGNIDLLLKRSSDGGKTWGRAQLLWDDGGNTCGNPCAVLDRSTGTIWLLSTHNIGSDKEAAIVNQTSHGSRSVWVLQSQDHGKSWSRPVDITATTKNSAWTWYATGPGVGIQVRSGLHAGRLVIPCDHDYKPAEGKSTRGSHIIYSDDHGATWKLGGLIRPEMNECQVAELFDGKGTLLMDMRSYRGHALRAQSTSADGGATWSDPVDAPTLVEPICQASLVRWEMDAAGKAGSLLFSNPAHKSKRMALTVRASADDGKSWDRSFLLHEGPAAYSSLVQIDQDYAGCFFENGVTRPYELLSFARFRPADISKP